MKLTESPSLSASDEPARACTHCGIVKPASAFHRARAGRRQAVCAACRPQTRVRAGEESAERKRARQLKNDYQISVAQYDELDAAQSGKCLICGRPPRNGLRLYVDHCHKSSVVRGLLCPPCNSGLGFYEAFNEDAAKYLAEYGQGHPLLGAARL